MTLTTIALLAVVALLLAIGALMWTMRHHQGTPPAEDSSAAPTAPVRKDSKQQS